MRGSPCLRDHRPRPISDPPAEVPMVAEVVAAVKPRLRGWLHAGTAPLALAAGIVLVSLAPTTLGVIGGAVFLAASVLLFGTSGIYHRVAPGVTTRRGGVASAGPRQHLCLHRRDLHPARIAHARRRIAGGAAASDLGRGPRRLCVPAVLVVRAALALHRAVSADGLGGTRLARRLLRRGRASGVDLDHGRRALLHSWAPWSTVASARTRRRPGSASTRSSTPARSGPRPFAICHYAADLAWSIVRGLAEALELFSQLLQPTVTGSRQTKCRQTYAVGRPSSSGRSASRANPGWSGCPATITEPAGATRWASRTRASRVGSARSRRSPPAPAYAAGPADRIGQQPAGEPGRPTSQRPGAGRGPLGAVGVPVLPGQLGHQASACIAALKPEGVALSVGSCGRV